MSALRGRPFFLTSFEDHAHIVDGRWPQGSPVIGEKGLEIEVVLGTQTSKRAALPLGSRRDLVPFLTDPSERISITVVGLAEPNDPNEEYWINSTVTYFSLREQDDRILAPFFVTEESFFGGLGTKYPSLVGDFTWFLFVNTDLLTASKVKPTQEGLRGLETDINRQFPRTLVLTALEPTLADYQRQLLLARVPIFLFISLVVVVIFYFLALVMSLLARTRSDEASLLRSRGASVLQVSGVLMLGEGVVTILAMIAGPFLALAIVRFLLLSTIDPEGGGSEPLAVGISPGMFWMGAAGGVLSLVVLVATSVSRARLGVVESLTARSRPPAVPFLQRYYIDLLILAAVVFLIWQIQSLGGFFELNLSTKDVEVELVLLFGPVLGLIGFAVVMLRLLPWLFRLAAWMAARLAPAWIAFPLARLARDPLPHGSLVIILMLAAALGVFGATFQSTLALSQTERTLYRMGGDVVLSGPVLPISAEDMLADDPVVKGFSPIVRDSAVLLDVSPGTVSALMALDPIGVADTAWFREDFAGKSLRELMEPLQPISYRSPYSSEDPSRGISIPADSQSIGIWIDPSGLERGIILPSITLWARIIDANGRYHNVRLGDVTQGTINPGSSSLQSTPAAPGNPWVYLEAPIPETRNPAGEPYQLVSVFFSQSSFTRTPPGNIKLDDITVKSPSTPGGSLIIEDYENGGRWVALINEGVVADKVELIPDAARTGRAGLNFVWQESLGDSPRGAIIPPRPYPLPAIGSAHFQPGQIIRLESDGRLLPVKIWGNTDFFPTLDPSHRPFLILRLEDYRKYVRRSYQGKVETPEEFWVSLKDGANRGQALAGLQERFGKYARIKDRDLLVDVARRNPLAGGGWNGLTILGMAAITVSVILTLVIHSVVAIRTGRVDLSVASTLGFSRMQLFLSLAVERVFLAVVGLVVGSLVGVWLSRWVLGFLDITVRGRPVIPPMNSSVQEWLLVLVLAGLVAAAILGILVAGESARRLRAAEVLRTGE
ncbi:MAG: FtsX-like permease family protein [Chloroflexi bacterium]|nr:FtsX-like permease family protein [Chloroflexota bacterium]